MPNFTATPAALRIAGGTATFVPARFSASAAALRLVGGTAAFTIGDQADVTVATPKLDRAPDSLPIGEVRDGKIYYTIKEQLRQQRVLEAIERAFQAIDARDDNQDSVIARLDAAYNLASSANAQAAATARAGNLAGSYTDPVGVLTASNTGVVTIAAHSRVYTDGTQVSVDGGSVGGFAANTYVTIYYTDTARVGGAVAYSGTTAAVSQTGDTHIVGQVSIPATGEAPVPGSGPTAPGYTGPPPQYDPRDLEYEYLS